MKSETGTKAGFRSVLDIAATVAVLIAAIGVIGATIRNTRGANAKSVFGSAISPVTITLSETATFGDGPADVGIVVFSDFECPYCRNFATKVWPSLRDQIVRDGKVLFGFKHLPLDSIHDSARYAAALSYCASTQRKFWPTHDLLFDRPSRLADIRPEDLSNLTGIEINELRSCLNTRAALAIDADMAEASRLGVNSTPTFFLGRLDGRSLRATHRADGAGSVEAISAVVKEIRRERGQ